METWQDILTEILSSYKNKVIKEALKNLVKSIKECKEFGISDSDIIKRILNYYDE